MKIIHKRLFRALAAMAFVAGLAGCTSGKLFNSGTPASTPASQPVAATLGTGSVKVGLLLPLSATGNAGVAAKSMRNAAEMAIAEFNSPDVQLIVKDDGGTAEGAAKAAQDVLAEGAEIILGPLFSHSVSAAGQAARSKGVPVIAFSTNTSVASKGVYLLSFLPESDVKRIVDHALASGKRSFAALVPDNEYGNVVEAAFKEAVAAGGGRIIAFERYPLDKIKMQEPIERVARQAQKADVIFIPDAADSVPAVVQGLASSGVNLRQVQLIGTGLWEDPRIAQNTALQGGMYPAPDSSGYRAFAQRYRAKYGADPIRTATLAYDAVSLVAALSKTQGAARFQESVLTNPNGFNGVDGVFRFRNNGTNERGLSVLKVAPGGGQLVSPTPKTFAGS